jgi:tetratricopeptide (TPR) repeat protein
VTSPLRDLLNPVLSQAFGSAFDEPWVDQPAPAVAPPARTPQELDALLERGIQAHVQGRTKDAMQVYREVLSQDKANKKALYFAAIALSQENAPEPKVLQIMEHAVTHLPKVPEAHYNLGILLHRMGQVESAKARFEQAIKMLPTLIEAKTSLGGCWLNLGDSVEGRRWLLEASRTHSASKDSIYSRAFARLTLGDLLGGLADYDKRWQTASFLVENRRDFGGAHYWNGKPIPGKTLYVHTEQGAGDVIMFSRFLEQVAERSQAKTVVLEVGESLTAHLAQLRGVDYVIASNTPVPPEVGPIHYYLPMLGVLRACGVVSYRKVVKAGGWLRPLQHLDLPLVKERVNIGIAWAGSKAHKNDRYRSAGWAVFRDHLLNDPRLRDQVAWHSLQVGDRARDLDDRTGLDPAVSLTDLTPYLKTFGDTASACEQLDLLIAVDTATVHAAASLLHGPMTWMLTPAAPDWRWLLNGEMTPWYDRVTLIRQRRYDDWVTPLTTVADRLAQHLLNLPRGD